MRCDGYVLFLRFSCLYWLGSRPVDAHLMRLGEDLVY